jgi:hypothetical protein
MAEHPIFKGKVEHLESKTFTDSPIEFTTSATILKDDLDRIRLSPAGHVMTWGQMMDNRQAVEDYLRQTIASSHSLEDPSKYDLNFLLSDAHVSDIQSTDNNGGLVLAGTLAMPHVEGMTFPGDVHNGRFRKVFDVRRPKHFAMGNPHSFMHSLKHGTVTNRYPLITAESQTLPHVKYPNGEIHGGSPFAVEFVDRPDGTVAVRPRGPGMLHGHLINNDTVYGGTDARPMVQQYLRPTAGDGVQTENHVHVPSGIYQESWFMKRPQYHTEKGPVVPLDEYTQGTYDFLDQVNSSRSTNFDSSGIWWNAQYLKEVPCIKLFLTLRVVPIVDFHEEGKDAIPYTNLRRHVKAQMREMD